MNQWLERYIFAVKAHLPTDLREDVRAELLADLEDELEHRAEILGREPNEEEVKQLVRERGHPLLVAADFQPRRTLVSEELFPLYSLILKWLLVGVIVIQGFAGLSHLLAQAEANVVRALLQSAWGMVSAGLYCFAWLTLIFYLVGESAGRADLFRRWRPESLPRVSAATRPISRTETALELVVFGFFLVWLNRRILEGPSEVGVQLLFSDAWLGLLPWINATLIGVLALSVAKLLFPYWNRTKLLAECLLYLPAVILVLIVASWDAPLAVQWGTGTGARVIVWPQVLIDLAAGGYVVFALVDVAIKIKRMRGL